MGQQVSKDTRSRLEHCTLEELLTDDKYIEELQRHLPGLPKRSHSNLAKILASWENTLSKDSNLGSQSNPPPKGGSSLPKDRNSLTSKLGPLWSIRSKDITISESVAEALKRDHYNLLRQGAENGVGLKSPEDHYEYTCSIETRRGLDRILWRFLTTSYHDIISELDGTKQRCSTIEDGGIAFVVAVICQSSKHDPDKVRKRVMDWVKVGRRYRGLMNALSSGCLVLFPEKTSDLVWEQYMPIKGDTFAKVIQFLQDLGIIDKCKEEGWNDLSDKILQTLREPFRSLIPFQFQPGQQSQIGGVANSSLALVAGDADIHRSERSILGHERVEIQDMDVDNPPSSRTLDSRALPRPVANRVIKTKRKKGTTSVRRQLQSFARDLAAHQTLHPEKILPWVVRQSHHASRRYASEMQHEAHGRGSQSWFPQAPTQRRASAPNDSGQWHLATNHQDEGLLSSQVSINDRARDPLTDISLNATNVHSRGTDSSPSSHPRFVSPPSSQVHEHCHDVDQRQRTGESISDTLRLERTGISTISALLNHDNNTPATAFAITQDSIQDSEDGCPESVSSVAGQQSLDKATTYDTHTELHIDPAPQQSCAAPAGVVTSSLRAIQFEKQTLQRIVLERPTDILGGIWFGCPGGLLPSITLRLSKALGNIIKASGREVYIDRPSPEACSIVTRVFLIEIGCFRQMIQRDGFGEPFWNQCGEEAFVTMQVLDAGLIADFIQSAVPD